MRRVTELVKRRPVKIRLIDDLTRYHPKLVPGVKGHTQFEEARWGCWCAFDGAGRWDIIMTGVEVIDEEYNELLVLDKKDEEEALKTATDVELHLGSNGGFRHVSFRTVNGHTSNGFRDQGLKLVEFFKSHGIPVTTVKANRTSSGR